MYKILIYKMTREAFQTPPEPPSAGPGFCFDEEDMAFWGEEGEKPYRSPGQEQLCWSWILEVFKILSGQELVKLLEVVTSWSLPDLEERWEFFLGAPPSWRKPVNLWTALLNRLGRHAVSHPEEVRAVVEAILNGRIYEGVIEEFWPQYLEKNSQSFWLHGLSAYNPAGSDSRTPGFLDELVGRIETLMGPVSACVADQAIGPIGVVLRGDLISLYESDCYSSPGHVEWNPETGTFSTGVRSTERSRKLQQLFHACGRPKPWYSEAHLRTREIVAVWYREDRDALCAKLLAERLGVSVAQLDREQLFDPTAETLEKFLASGRRPFLLEEYLFEEDIFPELKAISISPFGVELGIGGYIDLDSVQFKVRSVDSRRLSLELELSWVLLDSGEERSGTLEYISRCRDTFKEAILCLEGVPVQEDYWWEVQDRLERRR